MAEKNEKSKITREYIATSLVMLLEDKDYDNISITDIAEKAGVSRMTYYRNYNDKDDILINYLLELGRYFINEHLLNKKLTFRDTMEKISTFFKANLSLIIAISKADLTYRLIDELIKVLLLYIPEVKTNTLSKYTSSFYVGGIIAIFRYWFEAGMNESPSEIADIICKQVDSNIILAFEEIVNSRNFSNV